MTEFFGLLGLKSCELYDLPPFFSLCLDQIFEFSGRPTNHFAPRSPSLSLILESLRMIFIC